MLEQPHPVLTQIPQRWHLYGEHGQPVVEVDAEAAGPGFLAKVPGGRRHHPCPAHPELGLADPLVFTVLEHPQQLGLELRRQLADLIQEQCACRGVLEVAGPRRGGAGEGTLGVTEKGGFHQGRGDSGAVEGEVGLTGPGRSVVQGPGDEFLPGPRFALDQHREGRAGVLSHLLP